MARKKTEGLTFPSDPLAAMRELQDLDAPQLPATAAPDTTESETQDPQPVLTATSTAILTATSTECNDASLHSISNPSQQSASTDVRLSVLDRVRASAIKEPTTRVTVDMTVSLHTRLKQYCAMKGVVSIKALVVTLLDDFLRREGF